MKFLCLLVLSLFATSLHASPIKEQEITTKVNEVTVFLKGAQVSRQKSIELSKGKLNSETGEVAWELKMKPTEQQKLQLRYSVKYFKYRNLAIE